MLRIATRRAAAFRAVAPRSAVRAMSTGIRYTKDHEFVAATSEAGVYRVGVTQYAADELGDIVFVELPVAGDKFSQGDVVASIESVKAVGSLYAPADLEVVDANEVLDATPSKVNESPVEEGFVFTARFEDESQLDALMDQAAYDAHLAALK